MCRLTEVLRATALESLLEATPESGPNPSIRYSASCRPIGESLLDMAQAQAESMDATHLNGCIERN